MDKLIDSPWFLRLTALFLAILLVYTVQVDEKEKNKNTSSEEVEIIRDIPIEVYYDDENLIVTGVPKMVNVKIEGPANIVQTTKLFKDFSLFVDLRTSTMGEHEVSIEHENLSDKLQVRIDPSTIHVNIEEKITETFRVDPEFNERLLAEGYNIAGMEVTPRTIEVTGAKSIVESINFVKATVSTDADVKKSFAQEARVRVLDRDLNKLDIEMTPETVQVKVDIQENSKEVPIVINEVGTPPDGVKINSITPEKERITLSGSKRVLSDLEQYVVDVDVSSIKKSDTIELKLQNPKDVFNLSFTTLKVKVDVDNGIDEDEDDEKTDEKEDVADNQGNEESSSRIEGISIAVNGLDPKYKGTITNPINGSITLVVSATKGQMSELTEADFSVMIDASAVQEEGEHVYPILVKGPPQVKWTLSAEEAMLKVELV